MTKKRDYILKIFGFTWRFFLWRGARFFVPRLLKNKFFADGLFLLSRFAFAELSGKIVRYVRIRFRFKIQTKLLFIWNTGSWINNLLGFTKQTHEVKQSIGIVVITHKINPYLFETLLSIKNQTTEPSKVILVVSGDEQEHQAALRQVRLAEIKNLSYILVKDNPAGLNRNLGAAHLRTNFFIFLDGDDTLKPKAVEVFAWHVDRIKPNAIGSSCVLFPETSIYHVLPRIKRTDLLKRNQLQVPAAISNSTFAAIRGFKDSAIPFEHQPEDWNFWYRLTVVFGSFRNIRDVLHYYRIHSGSISYLENNLVGEKDYYWQYAVSTEDEQDYWLDYDIQVAPVDPEISGPVRIPGMLILADSVTKLREIIELHPEFLEFKLRGVVLFGDPIEIHSLEAFYSDQISVFSLTSTFTSFQLGYTYLKYAYKYDSLLYIDKDSKIAKSIASIQRMSD
jgi:glycosyltransferase involved in cell wall biosynthesis